MLRYLSLICSLTAMQRLKYSNYYSAFNTKNIYAYVFSLLIELRGTARLLAGR